MTLKSFLPKRPINICFLRDLPCTELCARHWGNMALNFRKPIRHRTKTKEKLGIQNDRMKEDVIQTGKK